MSVASVYACKDYKEFIHAKIRQESESSRGYKSRLATAAGIQPSYLSRVLNGPEDLTPDHAIGLARFWKLTDRESDYFLELLTLGRAATPALRAYSEGRLSVMKEASQKRQRALAAPYENDAWVTQYASSWHYPAVHMALSLPGPHTPDTMAKRFRLTRAQAAGALEALSKMGLCRRDTTVKEGWMVAKDDIQIDPMNPAKRVLSSLLLQKAAHDVQAHREDETSLDYTVVFNGTMDEYRKARELLSEFLEKNKKVLGGSRKPEEVFLFALHFATL